MKQLKILPYSEIKNDKITQECYDKAKEVIVGIANEIADGGYTEGTRNNMAVDFCVAAYCLGVNDCTIYQKDSLIDVLEMTIDEAEDMANRNYVITDYTESWSIRGNSIGKDIWLFAIDPERYMGGARPATLELVFELDD